jgi:hypothetical protein
MSNDIHKGDYVLATKWHDGSPHDQWCVGFYIGETEHKTPRHDVAHSDGTLFRHNGFRRVKKISGNRGAFILRHKEVVQYAHKSLWWWARCSMKMVNAELDSSTTT